ncbi:MAG: hypothetical protein AVDCRST_MAG69-453, partial [uncultured Solirubrobacteraceae bacterium]
DRSSAYRRAPARSGAAGAALQRDGARPEGVLRQGPHSCQVLPPRRPAHHRHARRPDHRREDDARLRSDGPGAPVPAALRERDDRPADRHGRAADRPARGHLPVAGHVRSRRGRRDVRLRRARRSRDARGHRRGAAGRRRRRRGRRRILARPAVGRRRL